MILDPPHKLLITVIILAAVIGALSVPLILRKVGRNVVYGVRTRKTLSDDAIWYEANAYGGWALLLASVAMAAAACVLFFADVPPDRMVTFTPAVIIIPVLIALVATLRRIRQL